MVRLALCALVFGLQTANPSCAGRSTSPTGDVQTTADRTRFVVQEVAANVEVPWSLSFAPDGRLFFTERPGRVRVVQNGVLLSSPALTIDDVSAAEESGALGLTLAPTFASTHFVYVAYTATVPGGPPVNRLVRYREVQNTLADRAVLLDNIPAASRHDGARVRFGPDGMLYMTMGDALDASSAQDLASYSGKIFRLNDDGTTPRDNPYGSPVFSFGHRNPQGIDWHPLTGELWETEHGNVGNDEVNVIEAGRNYGWPVIEGNATGPDMVTPLLVFTPAVAPSGGSFYRGTAFPAFQNDFFFATLAGQHIHRVRIDPSLRRIAAEERLVEGLFGRIRDVVVGPDGFLYFSTSNRDGRGSPATGDDRILRIVPAPQGPPSASFDTR
jgi:glucose/arabinose dehydrogenase